MTSQDYTNALIAVTRLTENAVQKLLEALGDEVLRLLEEEGSSLGIEGFGRFMLCKHAEHVVDNPATRKRMLVPPSITLEFLSDATLSACATTYGTAELARALETQQKISRTTAEEFVAAAVAQLQEALRREHYVNVPGLGTFKYIAPTGAVEFMPNAALRERANRPFAAFESIELEAIVDEPNEAEEASRKELEEMLQFGKELTADAQPPIEDEPATDAETTDTLSDDTSAEYIVEETTDDEVVVEDASMDSLPEDTADETDEDDTNGSYDETPSYRWRNILCHILLPILLLAGGYMAGHYHLLDSVLPSTAADDAVEASPQELPDEPSPSPAPAASDSLQVDSIEATACQEDDIVPANLPYADYVTRSQQFEQLPAHRRYMIVGKMAECTLQEGETLRQIARRYYKVPEMADYIQKFNHFEDADALPAGTLVKIPRLILKKTDARVDAMLLR